MQKAKAESCLDSEFETQRSRKVALELHYLRLIVGDQEKQSAKRDPAATAVRTAKQDKRACLCNKKRG